MASKYKIGKWATSKFTMKNGFFVFKAEGQEIILKNILPFACIYCIYIYIIIKR